MSRSRQHHASDGSRKAAWPTRTEADRGRTGKRRKLVTYKCEVCGMWHLGHDRTLRADTPASTRQSGSIGEES